MNNMPNTRPLTDQEREYYRSQGYNPDNIEIHVGAGTPQQESNSSVSGAAIRGAGAAAIPTIAGGLGAGLATGAATGALEGSAVGPVGTAVGTVVGGLIGSAAAGYAAYKAQEALMPDKWKEQLQEDAKEHPLAAAAGQLATLPLGGFNFNPKGVMDAGKFVAGRAVEKAAVDKAALGGIDLGQAGKQALINTIAGAGIGGVQEAGMEALRGEDLSAGSIAESALIGATFNKVNRFGQAYNSLNAKFGIKPGFHDEKPSVLETGEGLLVQRNDSRGQGQATPPASDKSAQTTLDKIKDDQNIRNAVQQFQKIIADPSLFQSQTTPIKTELPVRKPKPVQEELPVKPAATKEDILGVKPEPAIEEEPAVEETNPAMQEEIPAEEEAPVTSQDLPDTLPELVKLSKQEGLSEETQNAINEKMKSILLFETTKTVQERLLPKDTIPSPKAKEELADLGQRNNVKVVEAPGLTNKQGRPVRGVAEGDTAYINPDMETGDTRAHEIAHPLWDSLPPEFKALYGKLVKKEFDKWHNARVEHNKRNPDNQLDIEHSGDPLGEYFARNTGAGFMNRAKAGKFNGFQEWLKDVKRHLNIVRGKADLSDVEESVYRRMMSGDKSEKPQINAIARAAAMGKIEMEKSEEAKAAAKEYKEGQKAVVAEVQGDAPKRSGGAPRAVSENKMIKGVELTPTAVKQLRQFVSAHSKKSGIKPEDIDDITSDALVDIQESGLVPSEMNPSEPNIDKTLNQAANRAVKAFITKRDNRLEKESLDAPTSVGTSKHELTGAEEYSPAEMIEGKEEHVPEHEEHVPQKIDKKREYSAEMAARIIEKAIERIPEQDKLAKKATIEKAWKAVERLDKMHEEDEGASVDLIQEMKDAGFSVPEGFKFQNVEESIGDEINRRMKGAEVQEPLYSTSFHDFERADPLKARESGELSKLGMHFGNMVQAENRGKRAESDMKAAFGMEGKGENSRTAPYWITVKKFLEVTDPQANNPNFLRSELHTRGLMSDEDYRDTANQLEEERIEYLQDKLHSLGYDGLKYENDAEGKGFSYVVFDKNNIINVFSPTRGKGAVAYQNVEESPEQFNLRKTFHKQFIGERNQQKRIYAVGANGTPKNAVFKDADGTYWPGIGLGTTRRVNDTDTATHEAIHAWFSDNKRSINNLVMSSNITLRDAAIAANGIKNSAYAHILNPIYDAIRAAKVNDSLDVPAPDVVKEHLHPIIEELAAQWSSASEGLKQEHKDYMFDRAYYIMEKVFGSKFTKDFERLVVKDGGAGRSKWNNRTQRYYQNIEDPVNRFNFLKVKPELEVAEQKAGEKGKEVANGFRKFYAEKDRLQAGYQNPIFNVADKLTPTDVQKVHNTLMAESIDSKTNPEFKGYRDELTAAQKKLYDVTREQYKRSQLDQIAAGQMVRELDDEGKPFYRLPKVNEWYYPSIMRPDIIDTLVNKKDGYKAIQDKLQEHFLKQGSSAAGAEAKINEYMNSGLSGKSNQVRFAGNRLAEGIGLPAEYRVKDFFKFNERYWRRKSTDRAFYDNVEGVDTIARAIDPKEKDNVAREFHNVMEHVRGDLFDTDSANIKAAQRVATALMLGLPTNIHILGSTVFNPSQYLKAHELLTAYPSALRRLKQAKQDAVDNGYIKYDVHSIKDAIDNTNTLTQRIAAVADIVGKVSGRQWFDLGSKTFAQAMSHEIVTRRIASAKGGDKWSLNMMKHIEPDFDVTHDYSAKEIAEMASVLGGYIHGTHDPRALPAWMTHDSWVKPFVSLMSWSTAQTNMWMRHVWEPATKGNIQPLLISALGASLGGYVIKELRETATNKQDAIPTLKEISNSSKGLEGNIPLLAYNFMQMASYTGFAGLGSMLGKDAFDMAYKNIPQGSAFPLDEAVNNATRSVVQATSAWLQDPTAESFFEIFPRLAADVMIDNVQSARIVANWASDKKVAPERMSEQFEASKQRGNLRRFRMAEDLPYAGQVEQTGNPYMDIPYKEFKETQDVRKAIQQVPRVMEAARNKANGDYEVLRSQLQGAKTTSYQTMPSLETRPMEFSRYYNFLVRTQGEEEAQRIYKSYVTHNAINHLKSSLLP